jgi:hypothetical protein
MIPNEVPLEPAIPLFVVFWSLVVIVGLTIIVASLRLGWRWLKRRVRALRAG